MRINVWQSVHFGLHASFILSFFTATLTLNSRWKTNLQWQWKLCYCFTHQSHAIAGRLVDSPDSSLWAKYQCVMHPVQLQAPSRLTKGVFCSNCCSAGLLQPPLSVHSISISIEIQRCSSLKLFRCLHIIWKQNSVYERQVNRLLFSFSTDVVLLGVRLCTLHKI